MTLNTALCDTRKKRKQEIWDLAAAAGFYTGLFISMTGRAQVMPLVLLYGVAYLLLTPVQNGFCFLLGACAFDGALTLQGRSVSFILYAAYIGKLLCLSGFKIRMYKAEIVCSLLIIVLEFVGDAGQISILLLLINSVVVFFFLYVLTQLPTMKIDAYHLTMHLSVSFLYVVAYVIHCENGLGRYLAKFMKYSWAYRFGSKQGIEVGGAMAIPLYGILLIALAAMCYLQKEESRSLMKKTLLIVMAAAAMLFCSLTISRSFFLGVAVICILLLFNVRKKNLKKLLLLGILAIAMMAFLIQIRPGFLDHVAALLLRRVNTDVTGGTGGRFRIWGTCFAYLFENPLGWLIGFGSTNYPSLATGTNDTDFAAGAHNLILDIVMSWGLIGAACVAILLICAVYKIRKRMGRGDLACYIPLLSYGVFAMTALRTNSFRTWMFLLASLAALQSGREKSECYDT